MTLYRTVESFRRGIVQNDEPFRKCYMVCAPLQSFLALLGWHTELVQGLCDGWEHYWLEFPDGRIVDPTASQFNKPNGAKMPKIYIGRRPDWYKHEEEVK